MTLVAAHCRWEVRRLSVSPCWSRSSMSGILSMTYNKKNSIFNLHNTPDVTIETEFLCLVEKNNLYPAFPQISTFLSPWIPHFMPPDIWQEIFHAVWKAEFWIWNCKFQSRSRTLKKSKSMNFDYAEKLTDRTKQYWAVNTSCYLLLGLGPISGGWISGWISTFAEYPVSGFFKTGYLVSAILQDYLAHK